MHCEKMISYYRNKKYFDKQLCFMNRKISYKCKKGDYAKNKANEKQRKGD